MSRTTLVGISLATVVAACSGGDGAHSARELPASATAVAEAPVPVAQPAAAPKSAAVEGMDVVLAAYLHQAELLATDLFDAEKAATLEEALGGVDGGSEWHTAAVKAAAALAEAGDLGAARQAFGAVSVAMIAYVELHDTTLAMHKMRCPMAPAGIEGSWLQSGIDIQNPWYGAAMLSCGEVKW